MVMHTDEGDMSVPGDEQVSDMHSHVEAWGVCGNAEMIGDGTPSLKLQTNRPLVLIRDPLPNHSIEEIWSWVKEAHERWGKVCDWEARRIMDLSEAGPSDYVHLVTVADLGGRGVLADQMLPYSGGRILRMRINSRITWKATDGQMSGGTIDPLRTLCHEIGHFQGHSHWPQGAPLELMEPFVQQNIIRPQPTSGKMSAAWFGPPRVTPPPPPPPPPDDDAPGDTLTIPSEGTYKAGRNQQGAIKIVLNT